MPAELALALLELLAKLAELLRVVEDPGHAFLLLGRRIAAGLRFLHFDCLDASVLNAAPQLVDGQADAGLSGDSSARYAP